MAEKLNMRDFVGYSSPDTIDITVKSSENRDKYIIEDIRIKTPIDTEVAAYLLKPSKSEKRAGVHFIHWLETEAKNSNRKQFLPMAEKLASRGIASILPDCFWSLDADKFKEDSLQYTKKWWRTESDHDRNLIKKQLIELKTVEEYFLQQDFISPATTIMAAHDFGAMFAILLSHLGYRYSGYVMMAFTSRWSDWFRFGSKKTKEELQPYIAEMEDLAPINLISGLSSSEVFLQFATDDFYVPLDRAETLYERLESPKSISYYEAEHEMNARAFEDMEKWISNQIFD